MQPEAVRISSQTSKVTMPSNTYMQGVAIITGAASGIGRATAHTFVQEGCKKLVLGDIDYEGLQKVAEELQARDSTVRTLICAVDIASEVQVDAFIEAGVKEFGAIHYAVNNAGLTSKPRVRTHELPTASWDQVVSVNLRGTWLCERAELRQMMKQNTDLKTRTGSPSQRGGIVNISSLFGILSHPTTGAYSATKAGVIGMTRTDALAYAEEGIRVNSVLPGFVKTPMVEESIRRGANYEEIVASIPIRRWGHPEEVAEAIVFLASEKASLINGVSLVVDGGKQYSA